MVPPQAMLQAAVAVAAALTCSFVGTPHVGLASCIAAIVPVVASGRTPGSGGAASYQSLNAFQRVGNGPFGPVVVRAAAFGVWMFVSLLLLMTSLALLGPRRWFVLLYTWQIAPSVPRRPQMLAALLAVVGGCVWSVSSPQQTVRFLAGAGLQVAAVAFEAVRHRAGPFLCPTFDEYVLASFHWAADVYALVAAVVGLLISIFFLEGVSVPGAVAAVAAAALCRYAASEASAPNRLAVLAAVAAATPLGLLVAGTACLDDLVVLAPMAGAGLLLAYQSASGTDGASAPSAAHLFTDGEVTGILADTKTRKLLVFLLLNFTFMFVEFIAGVASNSLGLISDSFHMMLDSTSVAIGLYAAIIARSPPSVKHPFGRARFEVLSAFVNGVLLAFLAIGILVEGASRLIDPPELHTDLVLPVSVGGLLVNLVGVIFFHEAHSHGHSHGGGGSCGGHGHAHGSPSTPSPVHRSMHDHHKDPHHHHGHSHHDHDHDTCHDGHSHGAHETLSCGGSHDDTTASASGANSEGDTNLRGVYLHILADLLGSVGVIISSLIVRFTGFVRADAICSLCVASLVAFASYALIAETGRVLLLIWPPGKPAKSRVIEELMTIQHVRSVEYVTSWVNSPTGGDYSICCTAMLVGDPHHAASIRAQASAVIREMGLASSLDVLTVEIAPPAT
jgi:zinc transporter 5/7